MLEQLQAMALREWMPITLPSRGFYYGDKCPMGEVQITPWTTAQEEAIARYSGGNAAKLVEQLIKGNVNLGDNGLTYEDLLVTDHFYVLFQLRRVSLTSHYTIERKCSSCGFEHKAQLDLGTDLPIKDLPAEPVEEPFEVFLPKAKKTVTLKFLRVKDEKAMNEYAEKKLREVTEKGSPATRFRHARRIVAIDGKDEPFQERMRVVATLRMLDLQVMDMTIEEHETGLVPEIKSTCPRCNHVDEWGVPMTAEFFRPSADDIRSEIAAAKSGHVGD